MNSLEPKEAAATDSPGDDGHRRYGHANLNIAARHLKAAKIASLLRLQSCGHGIKLLEVGTGSGYIANYFASHPSLDIQVEAVDVDDCRQTHDGFGFTKVDSAVLPFEDATFDVVLSNHVIEHVGDEDEQRRHLLELRRVLKPNGVGYLAVPNRWQWVEPHYRLAGLSWLPEKLRSPYLRYRGRGTHYDCRPLTRKETESLLTEAGFAFEQQHGRALRLTFELERPNAAIYKLLFRRVPDQFWEILRGAFPTLIYILKAARE